MNYSEVMQVYKKPVSMKYIPLKHVPNIFRGALTVAVLCQFLIST